MSAPDTSTIDVPHLIGTLDDFSLTAANWWVKNLLIDGVKYNRHIHSGDPEVEAVRSALDAGIRRRILVERDGNVWTIAHFGDEVYPLFEQILRERGLRNARWPSGLIMWLSFRQGIGRIEVRKRRTRHRHRPTHNRVIYERFITEPHA